ncbi:hypothetical protein Golob_024690 [Gossypium lobatum]|uniref:Uncharacterized protein n=1 Tax=Gossypium lobatum TaxID=34289 RepID=A0A7J8NJY5_9ROSI|nr:hypothetical protein [Gossypium lobatum]
MVKEFRTKVRYAHIVGNIGYATLNAKFAEKEGREPLCLKQFRFQHLHKDGSDKLNSVIKQDEACKRFKDFMPHRSPSMPQDNVALENEVNTQVFSSDKYGKVLRYGHGMTKFRLSSYGSIIQGSQSTPTISKLIEEMNAKHAEQIQTVQAEQAFIQKALLEKVKSHFVRRPQSEKLV